MPLLAGMDEFFYLSSLFFPTLLRTSIASPLPRGGSFFLSERTVTLVFAVFFLFEADLF